MDFSEKYHLVKRLGSQRKRKFGEIFLATDVVSNETVVLKAVRKDQHATSVVERLKAEASFSFDFEGLPKTLILEETPTNLFLVRKYVDGVPLDGYWNQLKRKKCVPFLLAFVEKLSLIFDHLDEHNVIHCDIKPSNFLIEEVDDSFRIHLLDFGLSIRKHETEVNKQRKLLFPLGYAAPELLLNQLEIVDRRTDIFALGIVFWRLFSGKLPLVHPNPSITTNLQLTHPLPEHSEISKKMQTVLNKMTNKHQFRLPPNKMKQDDVKMHLLNAMDGRYAALSEVKAALETTVKRKFW